MCNISGYFGYKPNKEKIKILGLLGRERGTDSMGVSINGAVVKDISKLGWGNVSLGDSVCFIQKYHDWYENMPQEEYNYVIQHNRKKSSGTVKIESAHPFVLEYDKNGVTYEFTLVHNGTISNIFTLCEHFNKKFMDYNTDTEALAHLILEFGAEKVLPWYEGGAALVFHYSHEPEKMYLWKGASMESSYNYSQKMYDKPTLKTERPLNYIYQEKGVYFSSLKSQLEAIQDPNGVETIKDKDGNYTQNVYDDIYTVKDNHLFIFNGTKLEEQKKVDRKQIPKKAPVINKNNYSNETSYKPSSTISQHFNTKEYETNKVYFNGYIYIHLTEGPKTKTSKIADGIYRLDVEGNICSFNGNKDHSYTELYYFYKGIMVKDRKNLEILCQKKNPNVELHHVHNLGYYKNSNDYIYYNEKVQRNSLVKPLFSKVYIKTNYIGQFKNLLSLREVIEQGELNQRELSLEYFCTCMGLSTVSANMYLIKKFAIEENGWEDVYIDHFENEIPFGFEQVAHKKYKEWQNKRPESDKVEKEERKEKEERENEKNNIILLPQNNVERAVKDFNNNFGTDFSTKKECNTWYFIEKGNLTYEYNTGWGLDQNKIDEDLCDSCAYSDLPFNSVYLDEAMEEVQKSTNDEAKSTFLKDFELFEEIGQDIYDKYFGMNFSQDDDVSKQWDQFETSFRVLEGTLVLN